MASHFKDAFKEGFNTFSEEIKTVKNQNPLKTVRNITGLDMVINGVQGKITKKLQ